MSDPVADKSGFLCMYMSNHPDTLVAYVKHFGKVTEAITTAQMTAIDSKGMTLTYIKKKSGEKKEVRVPIDPPLAGYEEVKPRLLGMKADAQEALGMIKAPQITTFHLSPTAFHLTSLLSLLTYCTVSPFKPFSPLFAPGRTITAAVGGLTTLKYIWGFVVIAHCLESAYTFSLCRRHRTPLGVGAQYILVTLLLGFPGWVELRQRIQAARIESVMKVE